ncbi:MAG TPA: biopolymer transporter ExbD [Candidatus Didemnitutus sp.]|nr:biopolymer transporter ExbD [Candidatus Didemnitutus sp.]
MSGIYERRRKRRELNLVPLIDVLVMLVFTAFITMQFKSVSTMNLTLPHVETAGKTEIKESITIRIAKDVSKTKEYEVQVAPNPRPVQVKSDEIDAFIEKLQIADKNIPVVIASDEDTELKYITAAMDACRRVGLNKIRLQSR